MGPTDITESEAMRVCCYANKVSAQQLLQRYEQIGGVPRLLFLANRSLPIKGCSDSVLRDIAERQIVALSNDLADNLLGIDCGRVASAITSLWSLYHLVPDQLFTSYRIELCCDNGRKLLRQRLLSMNARELWDLFYNTNQWLGTVQKIRFEAYALKKDPCGWDQSHRKGAGRNGDFHNKHVPGSHSVFKS